MSNITTTYREIEISYIENSNQWTCALFSKPADSLRAAKERVDKKLDTEKKKPFQRFKAFVEYFQYRQSGSWPVVDITSMTDDGEVWVTHHTQREKKRILNYGSGKSNIFPVTPENTALVETIHEHERAKVVLDQKIDEAKAKLQPWNPEA